MWRNVGWEWGKDCHVVLLHIVMNCAHSSESEITNCQSLWQFLLYSDIIMCTGIKNKARVCLFKTVKEPAPLSRQVHIKNIWRRISVWRVLCMKTLWRVLVPFTPLSSAVSHRRCQKIRLATRATRELEVCSELEVENKRSKSRFWIRDNKLRMREWVEVLPMNSEIRVSSIDIASSKVKHRC